VTKLAPIQRASSSAVLSACRGVSVVYGVGDASVVALDDVDVAFTVGERVALWGPSGSGKTTLLHVLGGLVEPTIGSVEWKGAALASLDVGARHGSRAQGIGYVFQGSNLLPSFTAFENVALARSIADPQGDIERDSVELLALVGLERKADHLPSELSGGESQRVAIARAFAQEPDLLLCDEPTGQLDSDTATRVLALIIAAQERLGFTLVIATHDADIAACLDRQVELHDGAIVEDSQ
jgi:putative ABC transport system ATP-binding protein